MLGDLIARQPRRLTKPAQLSREPPTPYRGASLIPHLSPSVGMAVELGAGKAGEVDAGLGAGKAGELDAVWVPVRPVSWTPVWPLTWTRSRLTSEFRAGDPLRGDLRSSNSEFPYACCSRPLGGACYTGRNSTRLDNY